MATLKRVDIFNIIMLSLSALCGVYLSMGDVLFGSDGFKNQSFYMSLGLLLILIGFLTSIFLINKFKNDYHPSLLLFIGLFTLFVINTITLFITPDSKEYILNSVKDGPIKFNFETNLTYKFSCVFQLIGLLSLVYIIFDLAPKLFKDNRIIDMYPFLCIVTVSIVILLSYIFDFEKYINFFPSLFNGNVYDSTVSFLFGSRNTFAFVIVLGIISCLYLHLKYRKIYYVIGSIYFYLSLVFTFSKTALILSFILLCAYYLYRFFITYQDNKKRNIIALSITCSSLLVLLTTGIIVLSVTSSWDKIISSDGISTLTTRFYIYRNVIDILNQTNFFGGAGFHMFGEILYQFNAHDTFAFIYNDTSFAHNAALELLGNGGVVMLGLAIILYVQIIIRYVRHIKVDKHFAIFGLALITFASIYSLFESGSFIFASSFDYLVLSFIIVTPIMHIYPYKQ